MQFGLTANGTPPQVYGSIQAQTKSLAENAKTSVDQDLVETVEAALMNYLDEQDENAQVSVSCTVNITVSPSRG